MNNRRHEMQRVENLGMFVITVIVAAVIITGAVMLYLRVESDIIEPMNDQIGITDE